jgi:EAL domain-containing protein (putative c-di-GMP-specific phosphodiesterase class I)
VNRHTGELVGAEALIRWQHPERGLLAPALFLPAIETDPLGIAMGEWVLETALRQLEAWRANQLDIGISVNVGAYQLQQPGFAERLRAALAKHPSLPPRCLQVEVLETSELKDMELVTRCLQECSDMGVTFALDDFGTGYSPLTYLKKLQVAALKIDRSFVNDMLIDPDDMTIVQGVIGLAGAFKRDVIAEGVETVAQGSALLALGCTIAQGFVIARPMPADAFLLWAAQWKPDPAWRAASALGKQP